MRKLLFLLPFLFFLFAQANAYNSSFDEYQIINISHDENETDYSILFNISYDASMQPDFSDLRFVDSDNSTDLNYWVMNYTEGVEALVWAKTDVNDGDKTIYLFYNNNTPVNSNSNYSSFAFYSDDFSYENTDFWNGSFNHLLTGSGNLANVTGGVLNLTTPNSFSSLIFSRFYSQDAVNLSEGWEARVKIVGYNADRFSEGSSEEAQSFGIALASGFDFEGGGSFPITSRTYMFGYNSTVGFDTTNSSTYDVTMAGIGSLGITDCKILVMRYVGEQFYGYYSEEFCDTALSGYQVLPVSNYSVSEFQNDLGLFIQENYSHGSVLFDDFWLRKYSGNISSETSYYDVSEPQYSFSFPETSSCQSLTTGSYTLVNNVTATTGTCFIFSEPDITLDCAGYSVESTNGYKLVELTDYNHTIKNCNFYQNSTNGSDNTPLIYSDGAIENLTIYNNTFNTYYTNSNGIELHYFNNANISDNVITVNGEKSHPIKFLNVTNSTINNNYFFYNNSTGITNPVSLENSPQNTVVYNSFTTITTFNDSVKLFITGLSEGLNVSYNFFGLNDSDCYRCSSIGLSDYYGVTPNYVVGNVIEAFANANESNGINVYLNAGESGSIATPTYVMNNYVNVTGTSSRGLSCTLINNVYLLNNYFESDSTHATYFSACNNTVLQNNTLMTNQGSGGGIRFDNSGFNGENITITNNTVTSQTGSTINVRWYNNVTITGNNVFKNGDGNSIYLLDSTNFLVENNNVTTNSSTTSGIVIIEFLNDNTAITGTIKDNNVFITQPDFNEGGLYLNYFGAGESNYNQILIENNTVTGNDDGNLLGLFLNGYWNNTIIKNNDLGRVKIVGGLLSFQNSYGLINYTSPITITNQSLDTSIIFSDLSIHSDYDFPANITFYGVGDRGFSNPTLLVDGAECTDCTLYNALTDENVTVGVLGFSTYTIEDVVIPSTSLTGYGVQVGGLITGLTQPTIDFNLNISLVVILISGLLTVLFVSISKSVGNSFKGFKK